MIIISWDKCLAGSGIPHNTFLRTWSEQSLGILNNFTLAPLFGFLYPVRQPNTKQDMTGAQYDTDTWVE